MMRTVLQLFFLFASPYLWQWLSARYQPFKFLGATICCFLWGMLVVNLLPLLPGGFGMDKKLTTEIYEPLVPVGIGVMLFCTDITRWLRVSFRVLGMYLLYAACVLLMTVLGFILFRDQITQPAWVGAMLTATYVGGTPNMAAIQRVFGIDDTLFAQAYFCDVAASSIYLLFVMVFAQKLLSRFMKSYQPHGNAHAEEALQDSFRRLPLHRKALNVLTGLGLSVAVFAGSLGAGLWVYGSIKSIDMAFLMIMITLVSVGLSFIPKLRNMPGNYETGDYLFCVFFLALGTMTDFMELLNINGVIFLYTLLILFGAFFLHILLGKLLGVDHDTVLITSAAGIMSPPFIPAISGALKNRELLVPGMAVAIIGLAAGNILGILIGKLLVQW